MNSTDVPYLAALHFCTKSRHVWQGAEAVMRVVLRLVHPSNIDVEIELLDAEVKTLDTLISTLLAKGYRARSSEWPKGPGGNPLCVRHGGIEMQQREKHGDVWHSHKVVTEYKSP